MNLTYRGIAYQASASAVDSAETGQSGASFGAHSPLKPSHMSPCQVHSRELTYRGIRYIP